jgi:hypothetical protein
MKLFGLKIKQSTHNKEIHLHSRRFVRQLANFHLIKFSDQISPDDITANDDDDDDDVR